MDLKRFVSTGGLLSLGNERKRSIQILSDLLVRYNSQEKPITTLSGGNQQKVLFGRAIAGMPKLVVMEDPTAGIDIGAKSDLYRLMLRLRDRGVSFLVFSSDLLETLKICDRMYSMYAGRIVREYREPSMDHETQVLSDILGQDARHMAFH
jgi:ribose transport system ATP-binding protein